MLKAQGGKEDTAKLFVLKLFLIKKTTFIVLCHSKGNVETNQAFLGQHYF